MLLNGKDKWQTDDTEKPELFNALLISIFAGKAYFLTSVCTSLVLEEGRQEINKFRDQQLKEAGLTQVQDTASNSPEEVKGLGWSEHKATLIY